MIELTKKELEKHLYKYKKYQADIIKMTKDLERIDAGDYSFMSRGTEERTSKTNRINDSVASAVIRAEIETEKLKYGIRVAEYLVKKIDIALSPVGELEKEVIKLRYFDNLQWWQVAERMGYSEVHSRSLRRKALDTMLRVLKC